MYTNSGVSTLAYGLMESAYGIANQTLQCGRVLLVVCCSRARHDQQGHIIRANNFCCSSSSLSSIPHGKQWDTVASYCRPVGYSGSDTKLLIVSIEHAMKMQLDCMTVFMFDNDCMWILIMYCPRYPAIQPVSN